MTPRHPGFAVAGLVSVLSSGAPLIAAASSPIGIDPDGRAALESQARFATTLTPFELLPDGKAADLGTAAANVVFYWAPEAPVRALTDVYWARVGAGPVSGWLGPQIGQAPASQVAGACDGRDRPDRGGLPVGSGWQLDGAVGEERLARLIGMADRALDFDPGVQLGDARCEPARRQADGVEPGGGPEGDRLLQATQGVQEVALGAVDRQPELVRLDAEGAIEDEEQLVRMIKSPARPHWQ
jgi:hypothetical protein